MKSSQSQLGLRSYRYPAFCYGVQSLCSRRLTPRWCQFLNSSMVKELTLYRFAADGLAADGFSADWFSADGFSADGFSDSWCPTRNASEVVEIPSLASAAQGESGLLSQALPSCTSIPDKPASQFIVQENRRITMFACINKEKRERKFPPMDK